MLYKQRIKFQFHPITFEAFKVSAPQLHVLLLVALAGHPLVPGATLRRCLKSNRGKFEVFLGILVWWVLLASQEKESV